MRTYPAFYGPVSAATDYTTPAIPVGDNGNVMVGATFSGVDVVGTLQVFVSIDQAFTRPIPLAGTVAVTASAETLLSYQEVFPWMRVVWDYTSGTGNITLDISIRQQILNGG